MGIFEADGEVVGYAVWREDDHGVYLRQFFVARTRRRAGVGRAAYALLERRWGDAEVKLDVLLHNQRGIDFWHALGFRDYSLILRHRP